MIPHKHPVLMNRWPSPSPNRIKQHKLISPPFSKKTNKCNY